MQQPAAYYPQCPRNNFPKQLPLVKTTYPSLRSIKIRSEQWSVEKPVPFAYPAKKGSVLSSPSQNHP